MCLQVDQADRNDIYWQNRRRVEAKISIAAVNKSLFFALVQHAGKRQLVALLAAAADCAYMSLRVCDGIAAEIQDEAMKDVFEQRDPDDDPLPQIAHLLTGNCDAKVGSKLNEEAKAWYKRAGSAGARRRHCLRMALAVWNAALRRMQAYQSGAEESYLLYHALHGCGIAVSMVRVHGRLPRALRRPARKLWRCCSCPVEPASARTVSWASSRALCEAKSRGTQERLHAMHMSHCCNHVAVACCANVW